MNEQPQAARESRPQAAAFDYKHQAWVDVHGRYMRCGHIEECDCYGRQHEGEPIAADANLY